MLYLNQVGSCFDTRLGMSAVRQAIFPSKLTPGLCNLPGGFAELKAQYVLYSGKVAAGACLCGLQRTNLQACKDIQWGTGNPGRMCLWCSCRARTRVLLSGDGVFHRLDCPCHPSTWQSTTCDLQATSGHPQTAVFLQ